MIAERWNAGATLDEIAAEMGLSRGAVAGRIRRLRKSGVALRSGHAGGMDDFAEYTIPAAEVMRMDKEARGL